jgi:hypothetical protein
MRIRGPRCPALATHYSLSSRTSPSLCLSVSVANPIFSVLCGLFGVSKKVNSFAIKQIQPLFPKCRGWGGAFRTQLRDTRVWGIPTPLMRRLHALRTSRYCFCCSEKLSSSVSRCLCGKSHLFSTLPPLVFSCLSFSHSFPLFSATCSLFFQNTGGGVPSAISVLRSQCPLCCASSRVVRGVDIRCYENHKRDRKENQESYE